jgi:predicted SprT family Zn-dependent metalloprotease
MTTVQTLAEQLQLWEQIASAVTATGYGQILEQLARLPVKKSRATRSLGAYVSRGGDPVCIRLQFAQEEEQLKDTLLHEIAHACDHLSRRPSGAYRCAHGESWRLWASALGAAPQRCGQSDQLNALYRQRLKLVGVCQNCGTKFRRVRRLNRRRRYTHPNCGGLIIPI